MRRPDKKKRKFRRPGTSAKDVLLMLAAFLAVVLALTILVPPTEMDQMVASEATTTSPSTPD